MKSEVCKSAKMQNVSLFLSRKFANLQFAIQELHSLDLFKSSSRNYRLLQLHTLHFKANSTICGVEEELDNYRANQTDYLK